MCRIFCGFICSLFVVVAFPWAAAGQSEFRFVETDLTRLQNGTTPVFRDVVATPDGGSILLYSSENMSREFVENYRGPLLPTLGIMKVGRGGEIEWSRFVDDLRELRPQFIVQDPDLNYIVGATFFTRLSGNDLLRPAIFRFGPQGTLLDAWLLPEQISGDPVDGYVVEDELVLLIDGEDSTTVVRSPYRQPGEARAWSIVDGAGGRFRPHGIARDSAGRDVIVGYLRTADERRPVQGGLVLLDRDGGVVGGANLQGEGITTLHDALVRTDGEIFLLGTSAETPTAAVDRIDTTAEGFSLSTQSFPTLLRLADDLTVDTSIRVVHNRFHVTGTDLDLRADGALVLFGREEGITGEEGDDAERFSSGGIVVVFDRELDTVGTIPIGRPISPTTDGIEGDPFTSTGGMRMIYPAGYPQIASVDPGTDEGLRMVGADIRGVPLMLTYSDFAPFTCMQITPLQLNLVATGDRLRPRTFRSTPLVSRPVESVSATMRTDTLRMINPCRIPREDRLDPEPAGIDLILSPNFIRRGEIMEVEVHIDLQGVGSFQIEAVDPESGDREVLITREIATPYNETISLPTADLSPGPYLLVLHAGEFERIVRIEVREN